MDLTTVKVSKKNHDTVRAIADQTGVSVTDVLDQLIERGLSDAKQVGQAVAADNKLVAKLQKEVDKLNQSYGDVAGRLEAVETELAEQAGAAVELTREDLLKARDHEPLEELTDHETEYHCKACADRGEIVVLDPDEDERCPKCGDKILWKDGNSSKLLGYLGLGIMAFALLSGRQQQRLV